MSRDYRARFVNRATYLIAGQATTHAFPFRDAATIRSGRLPPWMNSPRDFDFLDVNNPHFHIDRALFSAGQFMGRNTPPGIFDKRDGVTILGDSGGFQLIDDSSLWRGDATRAWVLDWLESRTDEAITLDIPTLAIAKGNPIFPNFAACLQTTLNNNSYFHRHSRGGTRFLTALQGTTRSEILQWYNAVSAQPFSGWAFGGGTRDWFMMLELLQRMLVGGLLGPERARVHYLGRSSLVVAVMLSAIQQSIREYQNLPEFVVTFDTSTVSQQMLRGRAMTYVDIRPDEDGGGKFSFHAFKPPARNEMHDPHIRFPFGSSAISDLAVVGDLYQPTTAGVRSWDALSREIIINHNLDSMLKGYDEANNVMELGLADAVAIAPQHVAQCYWALREAFKYADPLGYVKRFRPAFQRL